MIALGLVGCGEAGGNAPLPDAAASLDVAYEDSFDDDGGWTLNAGPDELCVGTTAICGSAEAVIEAGELRLDGTCDPDSLGIDVECPAATATRSLEAGGSVGELEIRADLAAIGGDGTLVVCLSGLCATIGWTIESINNAGIVQSDTVVDLEIAAHSGGETTGPITVEVTDDPEARDGIELYVDGFPGGEPGILYTSHITIRSLEIRTGAPE